MQSPKIIQFPFGSTQYLKEEHKKNIALNRKGGKPKGWKKDKAGVA